MKLELTVPGPWPSVLFLWPKGKIKAKTEIKGLNTSVVTRIPGLNM